MTLPSTLSDQDELMQRIARDLIDSYDEELELEIEDRNMDELESGQAADKGARRAYFKELFRLQGELVKLQDWVQHSRQKVVILFEGRDAAGKGGVISAPSGTSSATWPTCLRPARSCCSTAAGTTAPASSA
jgi:polyphosphate kinase